ncbi:MAG: glycosyl transferase family 2 [Clostridia bacterium]|jgi:glycosyltransferase involved in cell wall biosynthesis|nr:glycosyl transferase family 2 [Clostridia bacterium]
MIDEKKYFKFNQEPGKVLSNRDIFNDGEALISLITPYYNAKKYIQQTANSIFNQTFPYWEWIIVNDGSTEKDTIEFLNKFAEQDKRIKIFNKENGGPASARLYGAQNAKADIIYTIDSDDLIDNTLLECGYWTLFTNKKATWAYSNSCAFGEQEYLWSPMFNTMKEKKENLLCGSSFIRKDKYLELTEYTKLPKEVHEDWYMWLKFLAKKYIPVRMNFYGFWYRREEVGRLNSINSDKRKSKIAESYLKKVAKDIKKNVGAIQYPMTTDYDFNSYPKEFDWNRKPINTRNGKKRILFIFPWTITGGADIFNLNLIKSLKEQGYEISIITTESHEYMLRHNFEKYSDEFFDLTTFLNREDWASFIHHIIKSRNIDLVFQSNSFYGYYVIPWLKCMFPELIVVDYLHAEDWSWRDGSYPKDSIAISQFLDKTYTCTQYLKDLMYNKMNRREKNTDVVYIGTDAEYFNPKVEYDKEKELIERYKGKKVILFPCRLEYLKRPIFAIKLLNEICKIRKDIVLLVVGDGTAKRKALSYVIEYGLSQNVDFVGMKSDIRPYYKVADVTLVCSLTEGLTLTAYESLSMGVPVVSADVGGQKELIDDTCGKVVKKYQSIEKDLMNFNYSKEELDEYVNAIIDLIDNNEYSKIKENCRTKILNGFTIENMIEKMANEFKLLIENGTKVDKSICNNIEFAEMYLILFNEYTKIYHENPDEIAKRPTTSQILWRFTAWRILIKVLKKLKIIQSFKKYILKTDKQLIK